MAKYSSNYSVLHTEAKKTDSDKYLDYVQRLKQNSKFTFGNYDLKNIVDLCYQIHSVIENIKTTPEIIYSINPDDLPSVSQNIKTINLEIEKASSSKVELQANVFNNFVQSVTQLYQIFLKTGVFTIVQSSDSFIKYERKIENLSNEIDSQLKKADSNYKQINQLIDPAVSSELSKEFVNRINHLSKSLRNWMKIIVLLFVSITVFSTVFLFIDFDVSDWSKWILRISIVLPLVYFLIFSINQYNKRRRIAELYAHKNVIIKTLPTLVQRVESGDIDVRNELILRVTSMILTLPENPEIEIKGSTDISLEKINSILKLNNSISKN